MYKKDANKDVNETQSNLLQLISINSKSCGSGEFYIDSIKILRDIVKVLIKKSNYEKEVKEELNELLVSSSYLKIFNIINENDSIMIVKRWFKKNKSRKSIKE